MIWSQFSRLCVYNINSNPTYFETIHFYTIHFKKCKIISYYIKYVLHYYLCVEN